MPRSLGHYSSFLLLAASVLLLLWIGLLGIQRGDELAGGGEYAPRQFLWGMLGLGAIVASLLIPYRALNEWGLPLYLCCLVMLLAVYFFPPVNGSRRWIPLGFISFQPSELTKLAYILAISRYLMFRKNHRTMMGLIPPFLMTLIPVLMILKEPDLGTSLVFFPVLFAVLFAANAKSWHLIATLFAGILVLPILWNEMSSEQKSRVTAVFTQEDGGIPKTGDGYHLHQSKQMLALGGTWGSEFEGMPVSDMAAYRLPAGRTDFIFCLIGERFGIAGTLFVLGLFSLLICVGLSVASKTRDPFGRLIATGIVTLCGTQVLINTAMTVGFGPVTGLTLPLLSYGGSSLLITCVSLGLLCNIALRPGYDVAGQPFQFE